VIVNSAELVNLILAKLRRVEFVFIEKAFVDFTWGHNRYRAFGDNPVSVIAWNVEKQLWNRGDTIYTERIEGILNGMVRNDAGELVPCEN
jgi:hypothetical protein